MGMQWKGRLAGFGFLRQGESGTWRSQRRFPEEECNSQDHKEGGWCILNRIRESRMEILDKENVYANLCTP